jgi:hypothetical protein
MRSLLGCGLARLVAHDVQTAAWSASVTRKPQSRSPLLVADPETFAPSRFG